MIFAAKPECFGSNPGPQQQAENDCKSCIYELHCVDRLGKLQHAAPDDVRSAFNTVTRQFESAFDKQEGGDHYRNMKNQPFAFVRDNNVPHAEAECIYRLLRWRNKGGIDDLLKVIHTVELIIEHEKK